MINNDKQAISCQGQIYKMIIKTCSAAPNNEHSLNNFQTLVETTSTFGNAFLARGSVCLTNFLELKLIYNLVDKKNYNINIFLPLACNLTQEKHFELLINR